MKAYAEMSKDELLALDEYVEKIAMGNPFGKPCSVLTQSKTFGVPMFLTRHSL